MDKPVRCTRCRNTHLQSERLDIPANGGMTHSHCPRCNGKSFYDMTPQVAWCWASGQIEFGTQEALPEGAIVIANGPKYALKSLVEIVARHGKGASKGVLLVPGIPEADNQTDAAAALDTWLAWCGKRKSRDGVIFSRPRVGVGGVS